MTLFQQAGGHRPTALSTTPDIIADADTVEISQGPESLAMYVWDDDDRTWRAVTPGGSTSQGSPVSGTALYAVINLARRASCLTVVAWNDGKRLA